MAGDRAGRTRGSRGLRLHRDRRDGALTALNVGAGWLLFVVLAGALGAGFARWVLLAEEGVGLDLPALRVRAARIGLGAALLLWPALGLVLLRQLLEFRDPFATWGEDFGFLMATGWGGAWQRAAMGALLLPGAFWLAHRWDRLGWLLASLLTLLLAGFPPFTGHAAAGDLRSWTLIADWLHVVAAGGWVGTLGLVLALERRGRGDDPDESLAETHALPTLVARFSPLAMTAVACLAVTGLFASWVHVEGWDGLLGTAYGRVLLLKLFLVGGVLGLGALNYRRWTPRLHESGGRAGLRRSARWELVVATAVLAVTAVLVRTSPM